MVFTDATPLISKRVPVTLQGYVTIATAGTFGVWIQAKQATGAYHTEVFAPFSARGEIVKRAAS